MAGANDDRRCQRCEGALEAGYLSDRVNAITERCVEWAPSDGGGVYAPVKLAKRDRYLVRAHRCTACGWVDLYADVSTQP